MTEYEARLTRLEHSRKWVFLSLAVIGCLVTVDLLSRVLSSKPRLLEAERLIVRDPHGRIRLALGILEDGSTGLAVYGDDNTRRTWQGVNPQGIATSRIYDAHGVERARLVVTRTHNPILEFYDTRGRLRSIHGLRPDGSGAVNFYNESREIRLSLDMSSDNEPRLGLYDPEGWSSALLTVFSGKPGLYLYDRDKVVREQVTLSEDYAPSVTLLGADGRARVEIKQATGFAHIVIFDEEGNIVFAAP